jgi:hypothetical protein
MKEIIVKPRKHNRIRIIDERKLLHMIENLNQKIYDRKGANENPCINDLRKNMTIILMKLKE